MQTLKLLIATVPLALLILWDITPAKNHNSEEITTSASKIDNQEIKMAGCCE